jgi:predicted phosphate transport protein (TIGR00153 family)
VRFRLFPRDDGFYPLFDDAAENVAECARRFRDLLDHYSDEQATEPATRDVEKLANLISDCETRGDQITREIMVRLNKSFVTPFDREDIHALAGHLDEVVDLIDGCARRVAIFHIKETKQHGVILSEVLVRATRSIEETVRKMKDPKTVTAANRQLKVLEEEGDAIYHEAVEKLFSTTTDAIEVMKWKELYDKLEDAIDQCEDVGNTLQSIALKNA